MNEDLYWLLVKYRNESHLSRFKIDKENNKVSVSPANSCVVWGMGIFMAGLGVFLIIAGEVLWGLVGIAMGLLLIALITKCTVFDIEKKEIRRVYAYFIETASIKEDWITSYHVTAQYINGVFKGYIFDLQYMPPSSSTEAMMKGLTAFKTMEEIQRFREVITRIRLEMKRK